MPSAPAGLRVARGHFPTRMLNDEIHYRIVRDARARWSSAIRRCRSVSSPTRGVSIGKTNYRVRALVKKGLLKVENFRRSQNKLAYAYL